MVLPLGFESAQSELLPGRRETLAFLAESTGGVLIDRPEALGELIGSLERSLVVRASITSIPDGNPRPLEIRSDRGPLGFRTTQWTSVGTPITLSDIRTLQTLEEADLLVGPLSTQALIRPQEGARPGPEGFPGY